MNVVITTEHRFARTPDGAVWTESINSYDFWTRYLVAFDRVKVAGRIEDVASVDRAKWKRADGPGVEYLQVPNYLGPWEFLTKARAVQAAVRAAVGPDDAVIMRVSSHLAGLLEPVLRREGRPFGLEVVNDPFDVFAPGAVRYRLRPLFRWWFTEQLKRQCDRAAGVAYVTERALQKRYPNAAYSVGMSDVEIAGDSILPAPAVFTTHYSSVELSEEDAVNISRAIPEKRQFRLVTLSSLTQMYKAPDILIRAVKQCLDAGLDLTLSIAGDGKHRGELERLAASLGIADRVFFLGLLPAGAAVRAELDRADVFVLPSRCEGLPRAMVEAMARSLPCIGSTVGGIPELLPEEDMVPPGDVDALARKIREVLGSPERMTAMSARNLEKAREYRDDVLAARRMSFFTHVRRSTAAWLSLRAA